MAVIAGAGSGKTSVLTRRVAWRSFEGLADPMHTAVITFTRQAATELRRRLRSLGLQDSVMAGTFHGVSLSLLQHHWERIGRRPPTIVQDRRRLIGEVMGPRRSGLIDDLAAEIDWTRARNIRRGDYARAATAAGRVSNASADDVERVLADLETVKAKRGVIDLDDLLSLTIETAGNDGEFASILKWRLRHLYVDEAQDMNPLQRAVLDVWRADRDDLTLVGDPSQAIYGFNGSDPSILVRIEQHFPGVEVVRLDTNYRCTPQIVQAGLNSLSFLDSQPPELRSAKNDGAPVTVYPFDDEVGEAQGVARLLHDLHGPLDSWRQFAVLARTNAQLAIVRSALEAASVPVRSVASRYGDVLQRLVLEVGDLPSRSRLIAWVRDIHSVDSSVGEQSGESGAADEDLDDAVAIRVASAVDEFLADGGTDGRGFLAWVRTHRPFDDSSHSPGIDLLTFHAAKGREWDTVVLIGCEDGLIPHSSAKSDAARAEETRLFYVATTRAADRLVLTYCRSRKGRRRNRSPYLSGISTREPVSAPTADFLDGLRERRLRREDADPVLESLRRWRIHAARVSKVDPHLICPDSLLFDLARLRPQSRADLGSVPGLGAPLIERVGPAILEAVRAGLSPADDAGSDPMS